MSGKFIEGNVLNNHEEQQRDRPYHALNSACPPRNVIVPSLYDGSGLDNDSQGQDGYHGRGGRPE
jgi:hypothetical protein